MTCNSSLTVRAARDSWDLQQDGQGWVEGKEPKLRKGLKQDEEECVLGKARSKLEKGTEAR